MDKIDDTTADLLRVKPFEVKSVALSLSKTDPNQFTSDVFGIISQDVADIQVLSVLRSNVFGDTLQMVNTEIRKRERRIEKLATKLFAAVQLKGTALKRWPIESQLRTVLKGRDEKLLVKYAKVKARAKYLSEQSRDPEIGIEKQLKAYLKHEESSTIECKKSFRMQEAISISLTAFSNTDGGNVFIGIAEEQDVKEDHDAARIKGKFYAVGLPEDIDGNRSILMQYLSHHTDLDIAQIIVKVQSFRSKRILILTIPPIFKTTSVLSFYRENAYIRIDNQNKKLTAREVYTLR